MEADIKKPTDSNTKLRHHLRHPFAIPVLMFFLFFFIAIILFISQSGQTVGASDSRIVELTDNGKTQVIPTTAPTVGTLLNRLNITINKGDVVQPALTTAILDNNFQINIYRVHPVTVIENGQKTVISTAEEDPRVVAQQAGYTIYPQDYVTNASNADNLGDQGVIGAEVDITPSIPVSLSLYGAQVNIRTHAHTVGDLLAQDKIKTSSGNNVLPALTTPITPGLQILVVPVGQHLVSSQQDVPFPVQDVADPSIPFGTTSVQQAGVDGVALVVQDVTGTTTTQLQQIVVTQPVPEIVNHGTGVAPVAGGDNISWLKSSDISPSDYSYVDYIMTHESHWNPAAVSGSGCIGLGQSCSRSLAVTCPDWQIDAVCQLDFFNSYMISHGYGSWENAATYWSEHDSW